MMWFNDDPKKSLFDKIQEATDYYVTKNNGQKPNLCLVNPGAFDPNVEIEGMEIQQLRSILPGHLWIGMNGGE